MKKIQLSDGMPSDITRKDMSESEKKILEVINRKIKEANLSYVEINKVLYLADKELYIEAINKH